MIAPSDVTAWSAIAPWATPDQIEQGPLVADWPEGFDGGSTEAAVARILDAIERRLA